MGHSMWTAGVAWGSLVLLFAAGTAEGQNTQRGSSSAAVAAAPPRGLPIAEPTLDRDGLAYPVSGLVFEYPLPHPQLPDPSGIAQVVVRLSPTPQGWIGPVEGARVERVRLVDIGRGGEWTLYGSAVAAITSAVRDAMELQYGLLGHLVTPSADEIDFEATRADLREPGRTLLTIQVWRAAVGEVRTKGFGQKWEGVTDTLDLDRHARLRAQSAVREGDLLSRAQIDREVARWNRHPGRQVDVALGPSGEPGDVVLDYLVTEAKDWLVYGQASNTGTQSTDDWVYRLGYRNNQLVGRDDILTFDYITAGFDDSHAVLGSYEFPIHPSGRLRARAHARYSEYTAGDVGLGFDSFFGQGYEFGGQIAWNIWQDGPAFIDLFGGARLESIKVNNRLFGIKGDEEFLLPFVGVRFERQTRLSAFQAEAQVEWNLDDIAGTSQSGAVRLGRFAVEDDFAVLKAGASASFFLEPLLNPAGFRGERGPDEMTLAHEVFLSVRGQTTFGDRVVPNFEQTAGGFFTVRGYDESIAVGDDAILATAEYRFHLGRALPERAELATLMGRPFRQARTEAYGSADWNVIFRGFVDAARVENNDRLTLSETDATLVGVGAGVEVQVRTNVSLRLDYGLALTGVGEGSTRRSDAHDSRLHFMATLVF